MVPSEIKADRTWYRDSLRRLLDMAGRGEIAPEVGAVRPPAKAADAHTALERREITGKVVLTTE
jgi:NADPH2:quinone reductase